MDKPCTEPKEPPAPISLEVIRFAGEVAFMAEAVAETTQAKLSTVTLPGAFLDDPKGTSDLKEAEREYPELFDVIRCELKRIKQALRSIESSIRRTEL